MTSTARYDRDIRNAEQRLAAIGRKETWALTVREQARLAGHGAVVVGMATRLKDSRSARAVEQIWEGAAARIRAEIAAAEKERQRLLDAAADRKAQRGGWW